MGSVYGRLSSSVGTLRSRLFHFSCAPALTAAITCSPLMLSRGGLPRNKGWHFHHGRSAIVDICSPNPLHAEQLNAAMASGKHIYSNKPLTATMQEAEDVGLVMKGWRGIGWVTFQNRFFSGVQRARQLIDEGFLGSLVSFRAVYLRSGSADHSAPLKWKLRASRGRSPTVPGFTSPVPDRLAGSTNGGDQGGDPYPVSHAPQRQPRRESCRRRGPGGLHGPSGGRRAGHAGGRQDRHGVGRRSARRAPQHPGRPPLRP